MRKSVAVWIAIGLFTIVNAQEKRASHVVNVRVLAGDLRQSAPVQVLASPQLRVSPGQPATLEFGEAPNGHRFRLELTASDLGDGRIGLRVTAETRETNKVDKSTFDLISGANTVMPTVALRGPTGAQLTDKMGRPMFLELDVASQR